MLPMRSRRRAAFTLIELLVVIAIIAILVGLLMSAVFYIYIKMLDAGARNDVSQLSQSLNTFKTKYGAYPPHQIRLCSNRSQYFKNGTDPLDAISVAFIDKMWPNIGNFSSVRWDGASTNLNVVLDGDQSMVYFLSGIPLNGLGTPGSGFSTNVKDPSTPGGSRVPPFYDFQGGRLYVRPGAANNFPSYKDYYGQQPYIYFSSHDVDNGYNAYYPANTIYSITLPNTTGGGNATIQPYYSVAPTVAGNVQTSRGVYYNSKTFQIITAGRDGNFNNGSYQWLPATATAISLPGQDDLSNFYDSKLGVPQ